MNEISKFLSEKIKNQDDSLEEKWRNKIYSLYDLIKSYLADARNNTDVACWTDFPLSSNWGQIKNPRLTIACGKQYIYFLPTKILSEEIKVYSSKIEEYHSKDKYNTESSCLVFRYQSWHYLYNGNYYELNEDVFLSLLKRII